MSRVLALCLLVFAAGQACAQDDNPFKKYGQPVNNFILRNLDGEEITALDLRGSIWVVNFFVPGCNECSKANPAMKRLQEIYRGKPGVKLVSIALSFPDLRKAFATDQ